MFCVCSPSPPEVHAGGAQPGEEPASAQAVRPVARRHRSDQLEVCGRPAEGMSHEGEKRHHRDRLLLSTVYQWSSSFGPPNKWQNTEILIIT